MVKTRMVMILQPEALGWYESLGPSVAMGPRPITL